MEYEIVNVNGRASYTAKPRRARRGNQFAIVIAAVVLLVFGPMNMPFIGLGKIETSSDKRLGGSSHVWSYDRVVASVRQLEHNGLKYARVGLTDATQGAVFHALATKRLDGVVVLVDGCGSAVDRWLSDGGIAVIRAAGRAHFLPIVVELPGDSSGRCLPTSSPQASSTDMLESVKHLTQLSGAVGLPLVFAGVGDGAPFATMATILRLMEVGVAVEAKGTGSVSHTSAVVYGDKLPPEVNRKWTSLLGAQSSIKIALITPMGTVADVGDAAADADRQATTGVELHRLERTCTDCVTTIEGRPAMDEGSLHNALRWVSLRTRQIP